MRPHVLITSNTLHFGGAERQRVQLANGLADRGYAVSVVLLQDTGPLLAELSDAVRVVRTPWYVPVPHVPGPAVLVTGTTNTESGYAVLWRDAAAHRRRRRWLVAEHTAPEPDGPTHGRALAWSLRRSDRVIALSETHWRAVNRYRRLHGQAALVVPNGVVAVRDAAPRVPSRSHGLHLVFVGRVVEGKGLDELLLALAKLGPGWTLDVCGDGPHLPAVARLAADLRLFGVRLLGWVADPRTVVAGADLLVLPSRREALPLVLLEAMALGVPVMATAIAAVPELLADGAGVLVRGADAATWASALSGVAADKDELVRMGDRGRRRVLEHYTTERMLDGYEAALLEVAPHRRLLARRPPARRQTASS